MTDADSFRSHALIFPELRKRRMRFDARSGWLWAGVAGATLLATLVVTQTTALVALAFRVTPVLGWSVALLVVAVYAGAAVAVVRALAGPPALVPPGSPDPRVRARYEEHLLERLRSNPECKDLLPIHRGDLAAVLQVLSDRAGKSVESSSRNIFMSTAVAQSGSLETLMVIGAEFRMADRVATLYWGPLGLRERLYLWKFLLSSGLVFAELEELEIVEEVRPVLGSIVGAALGAVPGLGVLSQILIDVWLRGGANAMLALRLGNATMIYCSSLSMPDRTTVSAASSAWARARVGDVVRTGAKQLADRIAEEAAGAARSGAGSLRKRLVQGAPARPLDPTRDYR